MRLYTRTGDKGETSIIGGRVGKDNVRVDAYGTVDELNSVVGIAMTELDPVNFHDILADLETIQHELFDCGGDLATINGKRGFKLQQESIDNMEVKIDTYIQEAPELERFILPGGSKGSAHIHLARTVARRAERLVVALMRTGEEVHPVTLKYLNRLSDYFFAIARVINFREGVKDVEYVRSANVFRKGKRKEDKS
ncbi:cob(I)yrinic acid a,c-diamide adenosyltransferase [Domibacillus sp. DTU_2020_1001157_1_SI_ALB_TIR_016]|uniref:cob(I)yrinic acid a,c-diamide adenosyltransferase n=1 Tax=Domibacillus sp. DTU_2020_1001157_1_SI_ALB_TIR_016 TaxID=3077789 RepID=UPI0028EE3124|nr:cob(I)yrinic acid a,c-diamide adenosyltransferase [Domibacillus sp. DTU_2020_1001157_1_SI_ALB_TIR_016]WNS80238.1 cob(I)yrinic acid a,c-diamide adenosyltransferase [Domibacillus sp. DTU_2020_1001157_1_SI_ALB_TIR_016]